MTFSLSNEEVLSDSEYESVTSHPSTPLEFLEQSTVALVAGGEEKKKKLRRGTGLPLPFFRFPNRGIDEGVEKIEDGVNQLLDLGETIRNEVESWQPSTSPPESSTISLNHHRSPAEDLTNSSSFSFVSMPLRPKNDTAESTSQSVQTPQLPEDSQLPNLRALRISLTQIRTHLSALESAISVNISAQLPTLARSTDTQPAVADDFSLPSFKVEKKNSQSAGAVLGTVKVACAVERGLEALIGALDLVSEKQEGGEVDERMKEEGEQGLMLACLAKPEEVALEMRRAIVGMRKALKANGQKGS